jgi:hypothetical protein
MVFLAGIAATAAAVTLGLARLREARSPLERDLGEISEFEESTLVPVAGLRFRFVASARSVARRTMVDVRATGASFENRVGVRLRVSGPGPGEDRSPPGCSEANLHAPPFATCSAVAGTGWDDGQPRKLFLAIDNLVGRPVSVDLRMAIMDPLE